MRDTQTAPFWLGHFPNEKRVAECFAEAWPEDGEDRDRTPLSEFARDQGENWYDRDFLEHGFKLGATSVRELVTGHSYHDQYEDELVARAAKLGLRDLNTFVFIEQDQIARPRSVKGKEYTLHYVGTITYRI